MEIKGQKKRTDKRRGAVILRTKMFLKEIAEILLGEATHPASCSFGTMDRGERGLQKCLNNPSKSEARNYDSKTVNQFKRQAQGQGGSSLIISRG